MELSICIRMPVEGRHYIIGQHQEELSDISNIILGETPRKFASA